MDGSEIVYYQDYYKKPVKSWPLPRVVRPNIQELVNSYVPTIYEPLPLDPKITLEHQENEKLLKTASDTLNEHDTNYTALCAELESFQKVHFWNNRANRDTGVKRLNEEIRILKGKKEVAQDNYNMVLKAGEYNIYIIASHKESLEAYERIKTAKIEAGLT